MDLKSTLNRPGINATEPSLVQGGQLRLPLPGSSSNEDEPSQIPHSRYELRAVAAGRRVRRDETSHRSAEETLLEHALSGLMPLGKTLRLTMTDNRYTMIAVRRSQPGYAVRLHRMFLGTEPRILRAIARYVVHNDRRASQAIGEFIQANQSTIRQQPRRQREVRLRTDGKMHDLLAIYAELNATHFGDRLSARITWGAAASRGRPQRSIKMGSFAIEDRIIRIHPVLDRPEVPAFFVRAVVFHEMLHGKHEVTSRNGRRCFHGAAFVADERAFADHARAQAWEKANIDRLLGG